jgi:hypothetical protein
MGPLCAVALRRLRFVSISWPLIPLVMLVVAGAGCGPEGPKIIEGTNLRSTYQGMDYECGTILLHLASDGGFILRCSPPSEHPCELPETEVDPEEEHAFHGTWESKGGDLTLKGDGITVTFTECEVSVDALGETELLPGLCWVDSSEPTFADSARLVARGDLVEFLNPSEGSGSRSSAL